METRNKVNAAVFGDKQRIQNLLADIRCSEFANYHYIKDPVSAKECSLAIIEVDTNDLMTLIAAASNIRFIHEHQPAVRIVVVEIDSKVSPATPESPIQDSERVEFIKAHEKLAQYFIYPSDDVKAKDALSNAIRGIDINAAVIGNEQPLEDLIGSIDGKEFASYTFYEGKALDSIWEAHIHPVLIMVFSIGKGDLESNLHDISHYLQLIRNEESITERVILVGLDAEEEHPEKTDAACNQFVSDFRLTTYVRYKWGDADNSLRLKEAICGVLPAEEKLALFEAQQSQSLEKAKKILKQYTVTGFLGLGRNRYAAEVQAIVAAIDKRAINGMAEVFERLDKIKIDRPDAELDKCRKALDVLNQSLVSKTSLRTTRK